MVYSYFYKYLIIECVPIFKFFKLESVYYLRGLFIIFLIDSLLVDDEPLWEPLEWSLFQTWIIFIFIFTWIAEVVFTSRYGSFTNRDKLVWIGLYKTYWLIQYWLLFNWIFVTIFVTMPFYYEITYSISYLVVWWNWYNTIFFYKLILIFSFILYSAYIIKYQIRWLEVNQLLIYLIFIAIILSYLLYFISLYCLFGFFTDQINYQKTGWLENYKITHGSLKWEWGLESRDHFSYHRTVSNFWYKNDPLLAASMFFFNLFIYLFFFIFYLKLLTIIRIVYTTGDISYTLITMWVSSLKHFYLLLSSFIFLIFLSFLYQLIRFPYELYWFNCLIYLSYIQLTVIYDLISIILY